MCVSQCSDQEAKNDLKKVIKEPGSASDENKNSRTKKADLEAMASTAEVGCRKKPQASTMKELKDADASSENEKASQQYAEEDDEQQSQESSNDDDLFQGIFALRDAEETREPADDMGRFGKLPEKLRLTLSNFEPELLQSMPADISENLGCT